MAKEGKSLVTVNKTEGLSGFVFFAAWIGAVVYFVGRADGFWNIILAFLKACVWPAFLVHRAFELLSI